MKNIADIPVLMRKVCTAIKIGQTKGLAGICQVIGRKLIEYGDGCNISTLKSTLPAPLTSDLLFRYATCDDLIMLMARYPEYCFFGREASHTRTWGLKQMGTLFCAEMINIISPDRILEIGAGFNTFFDEHYADSREYWMIDDTVGFTSEEKFEAAIEQRHNTHFVRSLLGSFSSELPDNYFGLLFSISALEHVPPEKCIDVYKDMFRVVQPGGVVVHAIDISDQKRGMRQYQLMKNVGFRVASIPDLTLRTRHGEGPSTLFEPLDIVFRAYFGVGRDDMWTNLRSVTELTPTILVVSKKPE